MTSAPRVLAGLLVGASASSGCGSRQKQTVDPTVLIAPPYDSTKRDSTGPVAVTFLIEKPVAASPSNEPPIFPPELRKTKPHGEVFVQFVVDTTGRPEMWTFNVVKSTDDLFSESVRRAVSRYRFFPAEIGGRKVRQLVKMPFIFDIMSPS